MLRVTQLSTPGGVIEPREPAVDEESGTADIAHRLVRVTHSREIQIANRVGGVEPHQDVAISDDKASRHAYARPILGEGRGPGHQQPGFPVPPAHPYNLHTRASP